MSTDDSRSVPPSFRPASSGKRPDPRTARPVRGREPAPRQSDVPPAADRAAAPPRRNPREAVRKQPRGQGAARAQGRPALERRGSPPPSYAPAGAAGAQPAEAPRRAVETPRRPEGRAPGGPGGPARPGRPGGASGAAPRPPRRRRRGRRVAVLLVLLLVLLLAWPIGLLVYANGRIEHTSALTDADGTPGTTFLLAGSDSRADGAIGEDGTQGQRSDTIMVLHSAGGTSALISLPRDTLVEIPGQGANKLNAAYSIGGPELLTATVEQLTGLTVDHYVEIGMGGVQGVVDAVGGVELCLDYDVDDPLSGLQWQAGCHLADGETALAFARMRYEDPRGDIGRAERQRQVVAAVMAQVGQPSTLVNPVDHVQLVNAGTGAVVTDHDTGIIDLGRMAWAFRAATGENGITGTPPIADFDYRPGGLGSTVLLDEERAPEFFQRLRDGRLTPADVETPTG